MIDIDFYQSDTGNHQLLVAVNSHLCNYSLEDAFSGEDYELANSMLAKSVSQQIYIQKIKVVGDQLLIADIMKSLSIYKIQETDGIVSFSL